MNSKRLHLFLPAIAILAVGPGICGAAPADIRAKIREATRSFKDITLTAKVVYANQKELKKIGKDFPKSYEFKTTTIRYKAPDKMKVEGKLGMVKVVIIMNGGRKAYRVPALHIGKKEDIRDKPHKRQTDIDIGIVTDRLWHDYVVRATAAEKTPSGEVYRITFVRTNAREKSHVCWVDAKTLKLLKLDKYESDGSLKSRYLYSNHKHIGGIVWVPGRIEVYNQDGKLAGVTAYQNMRVNTGIPDSEFKI